MPNIPHPMQDPPSFAETFASKPMTALNSQIWLPLSEAVKWKLQHDPGSEVSRFRPSHPLQSSGPPAPPPASCTREAPDAEGHPLPSDLPLPLVFPLLFSEPNPLNLASATLLSATRRAASHATEGFKWEPRLEKVAVGTRSRSHTLGPGRGANQLQTC